MFLLLDKPVPSMMSGGGNCQFCYSRSAKVTHLPTRYAVGISRTLKVGREIWAPNASAMRNSTRRL